MINVLKDTHQITQGEWWSKEIDFHFFELFLTLMPSSWPLRRGYTGLRLSIVKFFKKRQQIIRIL